MKQPLAIVGASTRSAAASAARAGFRPLAADLFADIDLQRIATTTRIHPYPAGFLDWMRAVEPPAWMYTGALENHPELVDQMAWIAPLLGNPGDVLVRVRSPLELNQALTEAGFLFPETRHLADGLPADATWLAKTYQGASGSEVRVWSGEWGMGNGEEGSVGTICFQKRIEGTPCAAVYVAAEGKAQLLGVTRQLIGEPWLGAHGFQYTGSIGPWPIVESTRETLARLGDLLSEHFELVGLFGVDFMLDNQQRVWTIEVNPRYTASVEIVERCTGVQAIAAHVAACAGTVLSAERAGSSSTPVKGEGEDAPAHLAHGKAILFASREVVISQAFAEYALNESLQTPWPALGDVSPARTEVEAGRPVLTMFASGANVIEVERRLRERAVEIEAKLWDGL